MPVSPWIGSSSTAAVSPSTAASSAAGSFGTTRTRAPAARTGPAWTPAGWPTASRRCGRGTPRCSDHDLATSGPGAAGELDRGLVGLGARVAEEHLAAQRALATARADSCIAGRRVVEVGGVGEPSHLIADGLDHTRVAVADVEHRDPGQEVEVLVAVGVPQRRPGAADELRPGCGRRWRSRSSRSSVWSSERRVIARGPILVPWPASVNSSSSSEWGTRPSTM